MEKTIVVATDGSALGNPKGAAGWAWYVDGQSWSCGGFPQASNNYAELSAVLAALKQIPSRYPLRILTDSQYITKIFGDNGKQGYAANWRKNGWKKKDGEDPANLVIIKAIYTLIVKRETPIILEWVKGHNGHALNTLADELCTKVSGMIAKGKNPPKSPGWNDFSVNRPLKAQKSHDGLQRGKRVEKKKVQPVEGLSKPRLRKRQDYAAILPEYDDYDDSDYNRRREAQRKKELALEGKTVLCDACGTPISPLTGECKCSF